MQVRRLCEALILRRIDVFGPFRAVMAGRIGTWVARDCHIRVNCRSWVSTEDYSPSSVRAVFLRGPLR